MFSRQPGVNSGASVCEKNGVVAVTLTKDENAEIYVLDIGTGKVNGKSNKMPCLGKIKLEL